MNIKENTSRIKYLPLKGVGGSVWLFLELVVISVVAWVVIDPAVVNLYYRCLPVGYDTDRLIYAEGKATYTSSDVPDAWDAAHEYLPKLINRLKSVDGVENAYCHKSPYSTISAKYYSSEYVCYEQDTITLAWVGFTSNCNFFETYGLKPLAGSPSAEELSKIDVNMFGAINNSLINDGCGLYRGRLILPFEHLSRFQNDVID